MHTYPHPITGEPLPSVTTILQDTMPEDRRGQLMLWYASSPKSHIKNIESQERGNAVDRWAKAFLVGHPVEIDYRYAAYCQHLYPVLQKIKSLAEAVLIDEFIWADRYGGTIDIAYMVGGSVTVLDIKTKNHIFLPAIEENKLQVMAYKEGLELKYPQLSIAAVSIVAVTKTQAHSFHVSDSAELQALSAAWHQRLGAFSGHAMTNSNL